jgi:hypothetical protein
MKISRVFLSGVLSTALALPVPALAAQPADPAAGMSDEEKLERAKALFGEGNAAVEAGDFTTAVSKFEEAYMVYAPNLHVFNFNIGNAAFESGDCVKAKAAFQRFLDLVPEHPERGTAQEKLMEIERTGCANVAPEPTPTPTPTPAPAPVPVEDEDAPVLTSKRSEREAAAETERTEDAKQHASGLMVAGAVFTGLGVAGVIGGAVSLVLANQKAKKLADAASPGEIGFPEGSYADDEYYDLDRNKLPLNNTMTVVAFAAGGAFLATGIALLVVDGVRKKKEKSGTASRKRPHLVGVGAAPLRGGAGASASVRF